jgi:hypothetical protein
MVVFPAPLPVWNTSEDAVRLPFIPANESLPGSHRVVATNPYESVYPGMIAVVRRPARLG